MMDIFIQ